jgi:hypothetical protein
MRYGALHKKNLSCTDYCYYYENINNFAQEEGFYVRRRKGIAHSRARRNKLIATVAALAKEFQVHEATINRLKRTFIWSNRG